MVEALLGRRACGRAQPGRRSRLPLEQDHRRYDGRTKLLPNNRGNATGVTTISAAVMIVAAERPRRRAWTMSTSPSRPVIRRQLWEERERHRPRNIATHRTYR